MSLTDIFTKMSTGYIPGKSKIHELVKKCRTTGSVLNIKRNRDPFVRNPKTVYNIQQRITDD